MNKYIEKKLTKTDKKIGNENIPIFNNKIECIIQKPPSKNIVVTCNLFEEFY